ncbi:MAG: two pore domain potassium channel family protein [Gammaproteobacteria bacterium]|nr:two pore domain potassium channel family protein [Gammaproteobacteria bacterium]NIN60885.1 two pore domain potassium channel family protein [Gammaproteobacteria bacterium]NIO62509.1 two pore domain potassium channel family protein [Gammaproteobacteria bacterium]NIP49573.1 two pore domain potassium channel family protein [Gammaproteobacteria bacterium]NIQ10797.1 two pore domain potassium channel family protein [Gammaproteobacteria bacterium]
MTLALIINIILVSLAVLIHYEMLFRLSRIIPRLKMRYRFRVVIGIFGSLIAHIIEIWIFAIGYYLMIHSGKFGTLTGNISHTILDCAYFSFVTYTSLGIGDIVPEGNIRFVTGLEALTGLVLITWSASFLFIEMQKFWRDR